MSAPVTETNSSQSTAAAIPVFSFAPYKANTIFENYCISEFKMSEFRYTWPITNFTSCKEEIGQYLESPEFSDSSEEFKWCLRLFPKGQKEETKDYVGILLVPVSSSQSKLHTDFEFSILNSRNEKADIATCFFTERRLNESFVQGRCAGNATFVRRDLLLNEANELLPNNILTILCEGSVLVQLDFLFEFHNEHNNKYSILDEKSLSLFKNAKFSDVTLSVEGKDLLVHKAILIAASPVFAAMFEHNMEENQQNRFTIEDISYDVFREMLVYIYTGKTTNVGIMARQLLVAADKYNVRGLKEICQVSLRQNRRTLI